MAHRLHAAWAPLLIAFLWPVPGPAATLTIACGALPETYEACRAGSEAWALSRGHQVRILRYPDSSTRARKLIDELLEVHSVDIDVVEVDLVWTGLMAPYALDLKPRLGHALDDHFATAMLSLTHDGAVVAVPWFLSVGRLFYRPDLMQRYGLIVPDTWEELASQARHIQEGEQAAGNHAFWGYVWQGRAGDSLTVDTIEWIASRGVPPILTWNGQVTVDDARAVVALSQAASWIETISPPEVLDMGGSQSLRWFAAGNAAFLRYWSNGLVALEAEDSDVRGRVGMADLPAGDGKGGRSAAVLGGFGLAVSRYSGQQDLAVDLVRWLTSPAQERRRAQAGLVNPTMPQLYEDPELLAAHPEYPMLRAALEAATLRPVIPAGRSYDRVSEATSAAVGRILARTSEPAAALGELAQTLRRLVPARSAPAG
jgi:trehalose/maltose transport system substrate-binding protein